MRSFGRPNFGSIMWGYNEQQLFRPQRLFFTFFCYFSSPQQGPKKVMSPVRNLEQRQTTIHDAIKSFVCTSTRRATSAKNLTFIAAYAVCKRHSSFVTTPNSCSRAPSSRLDNVFHERPFTCTTRPILRFTIKNSNNARNHEW